MSLHGEYLNQCGKHSQKSKGPRTLIHWSAISTYDILRGRPLIKGETLCLNSASYGGRLKRSLFPQEMALVGGGFAELTAET